MPLWLILTLVGVALAIGGFAGLGTILLWVGLVLVVSGLVGTVVSLRRNSQ
ncbi:hypothetical protein [Cellulomonas sp. P5_E12]